MAENVNSGSLRMVSISDQDVERAADAISEELARRDEWYGLDNWTPEEVVRFVVAALTATDAAEGSHPVQDRASSSSHSTTGESDGS